MKKIEFYVGISYKKDRSPLTAAEIDTASEAAENILINAYGGYTVQVGIATTKNSSPIDTLIFTTLVLSSQVDNEQIQQIASRLAELFSQETVLFFSWAGGGDLVGKE